MADVVSSIGSRASWLWGRHNLTTGALPGESILVSTVLSWSASVWDAIDAGLPTEKCRCTLRGARVIFFSRRLQGITSSDVNSFDSRGVRSDCSSHATSVWTNRWQAVELALAAAAQRPCDLASLADCIAQTWYSISVAHDVDLSDVPCQRAPWDSVLHMMDGSAPLHVGAAASRSLDSLLQSCALDVSQSATDLVVASIVYFLTAGMIVALPCERCTLSSAVSESSSGPLTPQSVVLRKPNHRSGVAWTRQLREMPCLLVRPSNGDLDNASCRLWVYMKLAQAEGQLGFHSSTPHPCRLREELKRMYHLWTAACGHSFAPMRRLIGGGTPGLNAVRLLVYSRPRNVGVQSNLPAAFEWDFVVNIAAACEDIGVAASFEVVRRVCSDFMSVKAVPSFT